MYIECRECPNLFKSLGQVRRLQRLDLKYLVTVVGEQVPVSLMLCALSDLQLHSFTH